MASTLRLLRHDAPPLEIEQPRVLVGREASCDLVLEDKSVSRRHALLEQRGPSWHVLDQGSANGTFVNGQQVVDAELRHGQELRLGTLSLWVDLQADETPQTVLMQAEPATQLMASPMAASAAPAWQEAVAAPPPGYAPSPDYGAAYAPASSPELEAAALLGLAPGAPAQEVAARFRDMSADLEAKVATAPNAHLRATYQSNLDGLRRAYETLIGSPPPGASAPAAAGESHLADLPSAQPSLVPEALESAIQDSPRLPPPQREPSAAKVSGQSPVTTGAGISIVLLLGATTYFALGGGKLTKELATLERASDTVAVRQAWRTFQPVDVLEKAGALKDGTLTLCNKSTQPVEVGFLGAVYVGAPAKPELQQGPTVKHYNSQACPNDFHLTIPPGAEDFSVALKSADERCTWDGKGLFYGIWLKRPAAAGGGEEFAYYAGLLNNRSDCVTIGEGW